MVRVVTNRFIFFLALILLIALVAAAQTPTTGRLTGTIMDQQGGRIPRAEVIAKNSRTGAEFTAFANGIGVWEMPSIPGGSYTVSVNAHPFSTATFKEIKVDGGATVTVDATLQVGLADTHTVTISKYEEDVLNAPATATVISEQSIQALPTQNVADLFRMVPGVNVTQTSASSFGVNGRSANAFGPGNGLPFLYAGQNRSEGSKARNRGIEANLDTRLSRAVDVYANYSWQAKPEVTGFNVSELNLPPTHRFNAGLGFDYKRYLGNVSVGYVGSAYWQDISLYGGWTDAYTSISVSAGIRLDRDGKYVALCKISNLANTLIQNHIYGDILKRQISGEFKMRFGK